MPVPKEFGRKCHVKCLQKIDNIIAANRHLKIGFGNGTYNLNKKVIPTSANLSTAKRASHIFKAAPAEKPLASERIKIVPKKKPQPKRVAEKKQAALAKLKQPAGRASSRGASNEITKYLTRSAEVVEIKQTTEHKSSSNQSTKSQSKSDAKPGTADSKQALSAPAKGSKKRSNGLGNFNVTYLNNPSELIVTNDVVDDTLIMFIKEYSARARLEEEPEDPLSVCKSFTLELPNLHLDPINSDTPPHEGEDSEELKLRKLHGLSEENVLKV